jgi:DNA-binding transcriptional ArsR family regulator
LLSLHGCGFSFIVKQEYFHYHRNIECNEGGDIPMSIASNVALIASLLSDRSRSAIATLLLDGRSHPAGELAAAARVTPQTASFHLSRMTETGIVTVEKHGRHRYYRIGRAADAEVIEQLLSLAKPAEIKSFRQSVMMRELREARFCYDHLAGQTAVAIVEAMEARALLRKAGMEYEVTAEGESFFADFGLDLAVLRRKRRAFARCCLDWTERKHHLAGALGQALTDRMFERGWLVRNEAGRGVRVTKEGEAGIARTFGVTSGGIGRD